MSFWLKNGPKIFPQWSAFGASRKTSRGSKNFRSGTKPVLTGTVSSFGSKVGHETGFHDRNWSKLGQFRPKSRKISILADFSSKDRRWESPILARKFFNNFSGKERLFLGPFPCQILGSKMGQNFILFRMSCGSRPSLKFRFWEGKIVCLWDNFCRLSRSF